MTTSAGRILSPERVEGAPFPEIVGKWRAHVDGRLLLARHDQARRVQQHLTAGHAVDAVTDNAAAESLARMHAYLMGAPCDRTELDKGPAVANLDLAPMSDRLVALRVGNHPPAGLFARRLAEREVDRSFVLLHHAIDNCEIVFSDLPRLERLLQDRSRLGRPREQQAPRRVLVEPVHRRRRPLETLLQFAEPLDNAVAPSARCIHRQAGGLVDDHRFGVDEEDAVGKH